MLALVDRGIEGHKSETVRLEVQKATLLSLLSPMRKLPAETLLYIFQDVCEENILQCYPWCLEDESPPTGMTSPVITYLPTMAISSVCSRWRKLALSSPSLWANLRVETHPTSLDEHEILETFAGFIDTVIRYLKRSGDSPLRLTLMIFGFGFNEKVPCLTHLMQHAGRWKTLDFSGSLFLTEYLLTEYDI
ncbi:hypothetical protein BDP27DRAFT_1331749, partial [Rhodocollybia butyracea]